jgi:hypothetical protein
VMNRDSSCIVSVTVSGHPRAITPPRRIKGIHSLLGVLKGTACRTAFFIDGAMPSSIRNSTPPSRRKRLKGWRWVIPRDNARPHNSRSALEYIRVSKAERLPHLADSPDLTPSDFLLFGYIKGTMSDYHCESCEDLLNTITAIFSQTNKAMVISVFESWIKRPE